MIHITANILEVALTEEKSRLMYICVCTDEKKFWLELYDDKGEFLDKSYITTALLKNYDLKYILPLI